MPFFGTIDGPFGVSVLGPGRVMWWALCWDDDDDDDAADDDADDGDGDEHDDYDGVLFYISMM